MTPTEAILSHIIETVDATIETFCYPATALIAFATTQHIKDHPHTAVPQLIPEIAADPYHVLHLNQVKNLHTNLHPTLAELQQIHTIGNIPES